MFKIIIDQLVTKKLESLEKETQKRIIKKLIAIEQDPIPHLTRLKGRTEYKARVGKYRIIMDLDLNTGIVKVREIGHRKNIYKK